MGKKLKAQLVRAGISQRELAEHVGLSQTMITFFVRGVRAPSGPVLKRMAEALGCSMDDLL